ncbi:MAG: CoA transferase [Dehalococcoidia bacterium]
MQPLDGIRVLDWTIWQFGPMAAVMLADLGAEVIKIEQKEVGDPGRGLVRIRGIPTELPGGRNYYFETCNRHKKGIALDLKSPGASEVVYRLVANSDVFVQNFRTGVARRLGLDYATLSGHNPRLIYASASGWGPRGPESQEPAFDYLGLARSGFMFAAGEPEMPPLGLVGGISDQMGAMMLAHGVVVAVLARERFGVGQEVHVSHLSSMMALQGLSVSLACLLGQDFPRQARDRAWNPLWNHYRCQDGRWLALAHIQSDRYWAPLCQAVGRPELADDPRFATALDREQHAAEAVALLDEIFRERPAQEWVRFLKDRGDFIVTPINTIADLLSDPQVMENQYIREYDHPDMGRVRAAGPPVDLSATPAQVAFPAPHLGEHTEQVLQEVGGYTPQEIDSLRQQGVI